MDSAEKICLLAVFSNGTTCPAYHAFKHMRYKITVCSSI